MFSLTNIWKQHCSIVFHCLLLPDVCLKDTMSVADSLYNLQLIKEFCESSLQSCCPLAVEDMLYAPLTLHVSVTVSDIKLLLVNRETLYGCLLLT